MVSPHQAAFGNVLVPDRSAVRHDVTGLTRRKLKSSFISTVAQERRLRLGIQSVLMENSYG